MHCCLLWTAARHCRMNRTLSCSCACVVAQEQSLCWHALQHCIQPSWQLEKQQQPQTATASLPRTHAGRHTHSPMIQHPSATMWGLSLAEGRVQARQADGGGARGLGGGPKRVAGGHAGCLGCLQGHLGCPCYHLSLQAMQLVVHLLCNTCKQTTMGSALALAAFSMLTCLSVLPGLAFTCRSRACSLWSACCATAVSRWQCCQLQLMLQGAC